MRTNGKVDAARCDGLSRIVSDLVTLEHVMRWAFAENLELTDVVAMDEFTHDVIVALPDGLVLVFDST